MTRVQSSVLIISIVLGFFVRLCGINSPVADWHSHRQADTASVAKIFLLQKIDLLHPQYYDISNTQSGKDNPHGWRMVELPIYQAISATLSKLTQLNINASSRLISIFFSLLSSLLIFLISFQTTRSYLPSLFSCLFFLFVPFNIYFSRTILPEPMAVSMMLLSLYFFPKNLLLSGLSLSVGLLLKPYIGFILLPTFVALIFIHKSFFFNQKTYPKSIIFVIISLLPFVLWRRWITQFPEGIPAAAWLFNASTKEVFPTWFRGINLSFLNRLVAFRPYWFNWLFVERISLLILGLFGIIPTFLGYAYRSRHSQLFVSCQTLGVLLYFIIVAQGNIQHDYYQILIIPSLSFLFGFGCFYISKYLFRTSIFSTFLLLIILGSSLIFSINKTKGYYAINRPEIVTIGQKTQELTPTDSLIIAPNLGDTSLLYATSRFGWPTEVYDIEQQKKNYPSKSLYLVSLNYDQYTNSIIPLYKTIFKNDQFIILDLN